jgi:hypothetical protein
MSLGPQTGVLLLVTWLGVLFSIGATEPAMSCSSVFIQSQQGYRTSCSNGTYYTTRYRQWFKAWETRQLLPSGPRHPLPLSRQPHPGARQY